MDFMSFLNSMFSNSSAIAFLITAAVIIFKLKDQIKDILDHIKEFITRWNILDGIIQELLSLVNHVKSSLQELNNKINLQDKKLDKIVGQHELIIESLKDHIKANADHEGQAKLILSEINNKIIEEDRKLDKISTQHGVIIDHLKDHIKENAEHDREISSEIAVIKDRLKQ